MGIRQPLSSTPSISTFSPDSLHDALAPGHPTRSHLPPPTSPFRFLTHPYTANRPIFREGRVRQHHHHPYSTARSRSLPACHSTTRGRSPTTAISGMLRYASLLTPRPPLSVEHRTGSAQSHSWHVACAVDHHPHDRSRHSRTCHRGPHVLPLTHRPKRRGQGPRGRHISSRCVCQRVQGPYVKGYCNLVT